MKTQIHTHSFKNKTFLITGASRGIGLAIGKRLASDGANIAILAKTTETHPKLEGTIYSAAEEITKAGGRALPLATDLRNEDQIQSAVEKTVQEFGGIDGVILNASSIYLTPTSKTTSKSYDLMHGIILRGSFFTVQACLPHLEKSAKQNQFSSILALCPPLNLDAKWLAPYLAYSLAKFGLSLSVRGWASEFSNLNIHVHGLWPKTLIATAAVQNLLGGDAAIKRSRKPEIVADAAHWILSQSHASGKHWLDEEIILKLGRDPQSYAVDPSLEPAQDIYL